MNKNMSYDFEHVHFGWHVSDADGETLAVAIEQGEQYKYFWCSSG